MRRPWKNYPYLIDLSENARSQLGLLTQSHHKPKVTLKLKVLMLKLCYSKSLWAWQPYGKGMAAKDNKVIALI